jgi:hypothetical protein
VRGVLGGDGGWWLVDEIVRIRWLTACGSRWYCCMFEPLEMGKRCLGWVFSLASFQQQQQQQQQAEASIDAATASSDLSHEKATFHWNRPGPHRKTRGSCWSHHTFGNDVRCPSCTLSLAPTPSKTCGIRWYHRMFEESTVRKRG